MLRRLISNVVVLLQLLHQHRRRRVHRQIYAGIDLLLVAKRLRSLQHRVAQELQFIGTNFHSLSPSGTYRYTFALLQTRLGWVKAVINADFRPIFIIVKSRKRNKRLAGNRVRAFD